jgi:hypothetical protein
MTLQVASQVTRVLEAARSDCSFADLQAAVGLKDRVHLLGPFYAPGAGSPSFIEDDMFMTVVPLAPVPSEVTGQVTG